jgi:cell shape-determining protein MreC
VINNKKVFLIYIVFFFVFLTFLLFPKYENNTKLYSFFIKEKLEKPFSFISSKITNFISLIESNKEHLNKITQLEKENKYLININNYLKTITSKYADQYYIFHENYPTAPISIGASIIGDKNLLLNKSFVINKGSLNGVSIGNYVIDGVNVIGRIKSITNYNAEVVTVTSSDYGDEVIIDNELFIVTGTNNNYLSFLRQKNDIEEISLKKNLKVVIKNEFVDLTLGKIDFINQQAVIVVPQMINLDNLRVLING